MKTIRRLIAVAFSLICGVAVAGDFAVLAGVAVTCTTSSVAGDVGLANVGAITNTGCTIAGATEEGTAVAQAAYATFLGDYATPSRLRRHATSTMCHWRARFSHPAFIVMTRQ